MSRLRENQFFQIALVTLVYFVVARFGLQLATLHQNASPVWPASGLAAALVVWRRNRYLLAIWLGAWLSNWLTQAPLLTSTFIACGNTLEALIAGTIIRTLLATPKEWKFIARTAAYILGAFVGAAASAVIGTAALATSGSLHWDHIPSVAITWWLGDVLGILVIAPLLIEMIVPRTAGLRPATLIERALGFTILAWLCYSIFLSNAEVTQVFLIFPILLWASARFDRFSVRIIVLTICVVAIVGTVLGVGPFHLGTLNQNLVCLQLFLGALSITGLSLEEIAEVGNLRLPAIALLVSWTISGLLYTYFETSMFDRDEEHFNQLVQDAENTLRNRMINYVDVLYSGSALIAAEPNVSTKSWQAFVETLHLKQRYPALLGLGVIRAVMVDQIDSFVQEQRRLNQSDYRMTTLGAAPTEGQRYLIQLIEPEAMNRQARGFDISSEEKRRVAADSARDSGEAFATENITLVQDPLKRKGFLLLLPFYKKGTPTETVSLRRKNLVGFIYSPFVLNEFFAAGIGPSAHELDFAVYNSSNPDDRDPIFFMANDDRFNEHLAKSNYHASALTLSNRTFNLRWWRSKNFVSAHDTTSAWVAACGALISILIAFVVSGLQSLGLRAEQIAKRRTAELAASESALRITTRRMKTLIDTSPIAILTVDVKGKVTLWNPACERIFGWTAAEVLGKWIPFVPEAHQRESMDYLERMISSPSPVQFQSDRQRKDGAAVTTRTALMPLFDDHGKIDGVMSCIIDVTEEVRALQALDTQRASAVHSARMAALGEMAAGIAHEINNPLAIIGGQASFLRMQIERDENLKANALLGNLQKIEDVVFRISKIIKGLRTFSRTSEQEPMAAKSVDELVNETLDFCLERFRSQGIQVEVKIQNGLKVPCQGVQLSQVLLNLLNNSYDAVLGRAEPRIGLEAKKVEDRVLISVTDNGSGISSKVADRIMEPFFTTKPPGQGTGLGLSIAKGIVERHGGYLRLDRQSVRTCIVVDLPLA